MLPPPTFGINEPQAWEAVATQLGGRLKKRTLGDTVLEVPIDNWMVAVDQYSVAERPYTRIRVPLASMDALRFRVYSQQQIVSRIEKLLHLQDIEVGHPDFDNAFIVKGNNPERIRALFSNERIRALLLGEPTCTLALIDDEGILERPLPPGIDVLYYEIPEKEPDLCQLRSRVDLFTTVLRQLCQTGSASADNPFPAPSNSPKPE